MTSDGNDKKTDSPLQLDLRAILRARAPKVPSWIVAPVERLIRQKELNDILRAVHPAQGSEFASRVLDYMQVSVSVEGAENIPDSGRFVFVSNHPLGGLDGIALISFLGARYGDENIRFLVNDMLMNVEPLRGVFLPINKYGSQGREAAKRINETYASDRQILIFPAGLVSRLGKKGRIRDLEWQKAFAAKAMEFGRDLIPVYFDGLNSRRFYRTARLRKRLGLKVNIEQALLPGEVCKSRGKRFRIVIGKPVSCEELRNSGMKPAEIAARMRSEVYRLAGLDA